MDGRPRQFVFLLIGSLPACGCAVYEPLPDAGQSPLEIRMPWKPSPAASAPAPASAPTVAAAPAPLIASPYSQPPASEPPATVPTPSAAVAASPPKYAPPAQRTANSDPQALQRIMAELQSLGTIDPKVQQQLLTDLQQTDPALWPMLMQTFRAGLAYRQRAEKPDTEPTIREKGPEPPSPQIATSPPPKVSPSSASAIPPLDALNPSFNPRSGNSPGLSFPATSLLTAALNEAQRREAEVAAIAEAPIAPPPTVEKPPIRTASHEEPFATVGNKESLPEEKTAASTGGDWSKAVAEAIACLEAETKEPPHSAQEVTRHAWLRVLYLAAGRRDDALKPIPGIAAAEQDFWTEQLYALATYLDTEKLTDPSRRSAEAARHLAKATTRLGEASTLTVRNLAFCTEVSSYGVYTKFKDESFKAGQPLILYTEVENFKSDETAKGFHTALRSSYQILDAQGRRVAENDLALTEEYCQNRRRDYFIRYFLSVPDRIYAGKYTLQLTIVDTLSQKIGQSSIELTVVEK